MIAVTLVLLGSGFAVAQRPGPSSADTKGSCNGTAIGANITITVKCGDGITKEDAKKLASQYAEILRRMKQENVSAQQMDEKLDDIKNGVDNIARNVGPRRLSEKQAEQIATALLKYPPQWMEIYSYDPESSRFADDIGKAMAKGGWQISQRSRIAVNGPPPEGVIARCSKEDVDKGTISPAFSAFLTVLHGTQFQIRGEWAADMPAGKVTLDVGVRGGNLTP